MKKNKKPYLYTGLSLLVLAIILVLFWFLQKPETVIKKMTVAVDRSAQGKEVNIDSFFTSDYSKKPKQSQRAQKLPSFNLKKSDSSSRSVVLTIKQVDNGSATESPVLKFDFTQGLFARRFAISNVAELDPGLSSSFGRILTKKIEKTIDAKTPVSIGDNELTVQDFESKAIDEESCKYIFTLKLNKSLVKDIFIKAEDAQGNSCSSFTKIAKGKDEYSVEADGYSSSCKVEQLRFFIPNENEDFIKKI